MKKTTKAATTKKTQEIPTTKPEQQAPTTKPEQQAPTTKQEVVISLFGQVGFQSYAKFEEYITSMKSNDYNNILATLNFGVRNAIKKGVFSMEESEALSVALRNLTSAFVVVPTPEETKG